MSYPDQTAFPPTGERRFDCESVFILRGAVHVLTKWRTASGGPLDGTALYRLDNPSVDGNNLLTPMGERRGLGGWVTAADVSPDNRRLAVLVNLPRPGILTFDATARNGRGLEKPLRRYDLDPAMGQIEALAWTSANEVVVTNEPGRMWRFRL